MNILEKLRLVLVKIQPFLDPFIKTILILGIPLLVVFILGKYVLPVANIVKKTRFKGLPNAKKIESEKKQPKWTKHLILISKSIKQTDETNEEVVYRFVMLTVAMFITTYLGYGFWTGSFLPNQFRFAALFDTAHWVISLMAASLPYCYMRIRLHRIRVKNSYDLIPAVNMMLMKYVEHKGNLYYAVYETTKNLKGDILHAMMGILPALQGAAGANLDDAIELFVYRTHTNWSIQLGILIHKSEIHGDDIEQGLRWLISDMSEVVKITEEVKSENRENVQLGFFPFILLPLSIFFNQYPSGGKSWHYYFQTETGIKVLLFTLLYTVLCAVIAYMIQKPRNEV